MSPFDGANEVINDVENYPNDVENDQVPAVSMQVQYRFLLVQNLHSCVQTLIFVCKLAFCLQNRALTSCGLSKKVQIIHKKWASLVQVITLLWASLTQNAAFLWAAFNHYGIILGIQMCLFYTFSAVPMCNFYTMSAAWSHFFKGFPMVFTHFQPVDFDHFNRLDFHTVNVVDILKVVTSGQPSLFK